MTQIEIIKAIEVLSELSKNNTLNSADIEKVRQKIMMLLDILVQNSNENLVTINSNTPIRTQ